MEDVDIFIGKAQEILPSVLALLRCIDDSGSLNDESDKTALVMKKTKELDALFKSCHDTLGALAGRGGAYDSTYDCDETLMRLEGSLQQKVQLIHKYSDLLRTIDTSTLIDLPDDIAMLDS